MTPARGATPAGYSGTPLATKLGLKSGQRALFDAAPDGFDALFADAPAFERLARLGPFDFALSFVTSRTALDRSLARLAPKLVDAGMLWIAWPKIASGVPTDVTENVVRTAALALGLVDVKVCAIDATWSGLKLVRRRSNRGKS